jgi:hypothetical protein
MMPENKKHMNRTAALQLLEPFIGQWNTSGEMEAGTGKPKIPIRGTDTYEWLSGRFFVLHKVDVFVGEDHKKSLEVIAYDEAQQCFTLRSFDNTGNETVMTARLRKGMWFFENENLRFTGGLTADGLVLSGVWEQKDRDGKWAHLMNIRLQKI